MAAKKATNATQPTAAVPKANPYVRAFRIGEVDYTMDFHLKALAEGENACIRQGHFVSLLFAINPAALNLNRLRNLFACALHAHHPDLMYEAATELLQPEHLMDLTDIVFEVFTPRAA